MCHLPAEEVLAASGCVADAFTKLGSLCVTYLAWEGGSVVLEAA